MTPAPDMTWFWLGGAVWIGVALVAGGIRYELGSLKEEDVIALAFWPFLAAVATVVVALWSLAWIGRGPVRLVRFLRRPKLPRAEVRRG